MAKKIFLTQDKVAIVDDEDYASLSRRRWRLSTKGYAERTGIKKGETARSTILMHREILKVKSGMWVDHINGDKLDNRRNNLRLVTPSQNRMNSVGRTNILKGVSWNAKKKNWLASIRLEGKTIYLGSFTNQKDAALAYDRAAKKLFGRYAKLNFKECE